MTGVLRAAHFHNAAFVLLECVEPASTDPFVRESIREFLRVAAYKAVEVTLHLQEMWCAKRKRWWCLLVPQTIQLDHIPNWPSMADCRKVSEVIHVSGATAGEVAAFTLTEEEMFEFQARKPTKGYLLNSGCPLPTALHWALHSRGSQIAACPCECASSRLDRGGICAVIVKVEPPSSAKPRFRHLSATKVAVCNGLSPNVFMGEDHRLVLACPCKQPGSSATWSQLWK